MGRKRKERPQAWEAEVEEENRKQAKQQRKILMIKTTTGGRKRKQITLEEENEVKLTNKEKSSNHVSNSKRRKGLFSKAAQLCNIFDDTRLAIIVLSKAGKPYGFGHSSVYEFLNEHYTPTSKRALEGLNMSGKVQEYKDVTRMKNEIENEMKACQTIEDLALFRNKYVKLNEEIQEELSRRRFVGSDGRSLVTSYENSYNELKGHIGGDEGCLVGLGQMHATSDVTTTRNTPSLASSESDYSTIHNGGITMNGAFGFGGNEWSLPMCQNGGDNSLANIPISSVGGYFFPEQLGLGHEVVSNITSPNFTNPTNFLREFELELLGHEVVSGNSSSDLTTTLRVTTSDYGVIDRGFDVGNTSSMGPTRSDACGNVLPDEICCPGVSMPTIYTQLGCDNSGNSSSGLTNGIRDNSLPSTSDYGVDDHGNSLRDSAMDFDLSDFDNFDWFPDFAPSNNGAMERVEHSRELVQCGYLTAGDKCSDPYSSYQNSCHYPSR